MYQSNNCINQCHLSGQKCSSCSISSSLQTLFPSFSYNYQRQIENSQSQNLGEENQIVVELPKPKKKNKINLDKNRRQLYSSKLFQYSDSEINEKAEKVPANMSPVIKCQDLVQGYWDLFKQRKPKPKIKKVLKQVKIRSVLFQPRKWFFQNCKHYKLRSYKTIQDQCPICLQGYTEDSIITDLYCKHRFHSKCIEAWFKKSDECAFCRTLFYCHGQYTNMQDFQKNVPYAYLEIIFNSIVS